MIKVKSELIKRVICLGVVVTRRYTYYCDGRCEFTISRDHKVPLCYVVYRMPWADYTQVEIVGLFDQEGNRL